MKNYSSVMNKNHREAAYLYIGDVMHSRLKPFFHRFTYRVFCLLIDLDRLDEANQLSRLFAVNQRALVSFHEVDHGAETKTGLAAFIRETLAKQKPGITVDRIKLLCYPRVMGYVFNPISIYYCFTQDQIVAMVYEVRNTFGGKHNYVLPVEPGQYSRAGLRQRCLKILHVSPFIEMNMQYGFSVSLPENSLRFRILETDATGPLLSATLKAERHALCTTHLLTQLIKKPFFTTKVIAGIYYEALKLWMKGAKFLPHPRKSDRISHS